MFRYLSLSTLCDVTFTWFLFSWLITRHVLFNIVIWSAYSDAQNLMPFAWDPEHGHFFTLGTWYVFVSMIVSLQVCVSGPVVHHMLRFCRHRLSKLSGSGRFVEWHGEWLAVKERKTTGARKGKVSRLLTWLGSYISHKQ